MTSDSSIPTSERKSDYVLVPSPESAELMNFGERPSECCGNCPPIQGSSYDCTCAGNPRCNKNSLGIEQAALAQTIADSFFGMEGGEGAAPHGPTAGDLQLAHDILAAGWRRLSRAD